MPKWKWVSHKRPSKGKLVGPEGMELRERRGRQPQASLEPTTAEWDTVFIPSETIQEGPTLTSVQYAVPTPRQRDNATTTAQQPVTAVDVHQTPQPRTGRGQLGEGPTSTSEDDAKSTPEQAEMIHYDQPKPSRRIRETVF